MTHRLVFVLAIACALSLRSTDAQKSPLTRELSSSPSSLSLNKQWEYRCVDGVSPELVEAGTSQAVLDFSEDLDVSRGEEAEVVWAPDSKRFAFNYTRPSAAHTHYQSVAFYQLRGDKWVRLRSPADESSERMQLAQLAREHLPKSAYSNMVRDILRVRKWADANTAILYGVAAWAGDSRDGEVSFLFTLKFDDAGNWKVVKTHRMSKKELEEEQ
jgi:hypothetical protein